MWPSGIYLILVGMGAALEQQSGGTLSWEQIVLAVTATAGVLGTLGGLIVKGVVRFGYQVDNEQKLLHEQIDDLRKQLADAKTDGTRREEATKADGDKRLLEMIAEYRARLTYTEQDFTERLARRDEEIKRWETMALRSFNIAQANASAAEEVAKAVKAPDGGTR